jgi:hypothetical protein
MQDLEAQVAILEAGAGVVVQRQAVRGRVVQGVQVQTDTQLSSLTSNHELRNR